MSPIADSPTRSTNWQEWLMLLVICWLAFGVRVFQLDSQSLWIDEGMSLSRANSGWAALLGGEISIDGGTLSDPAPPIYYLVLAAVQRFGGETVFGLRLVSVWAGLLGVPILFALGRRLFGTFAGLAAALLGALSPYWVWYNQTMRSHSLLMTWAILSTLALHRLLEKGRYSHLRGIAWLGITVAMLYTHQDGLWVLAFELLAVLMSSRRGHLWPIMWATLALLVAVPLALQVPALIDSSISHHPTWNEARQVAVLVSPFGSTPGTPREPLNELILRGLRLFPTALILLASVAWPLQFPRQSRNWLFAAGFLMIPALTSLLVMQLALGEAGPRFLTIAIPALFLLLGAGSATLWRRSRPLAALAVLGSVAVMTQWLFVQFSTPSYVRGNLRTAAEFVSAHARENDVIVLHDALVQPVWNYYYDGVASVEAIPHAGASSPDQALRRFEQAAAGHDRLWFVHRPEPRSLPDPQLLSNYAEQNLIKLDQRRYSSPWLDVEIDLFQTAPPTVARLPDGSVAAEVCWETGLCLHGWRSEDLVGGQQSQVTLYWSQNQPLADNYTFSLFLKDTEDLVWSEAGGPIFEFYSAADWPRGAIMEQPVILTLAPTLPPTEYRLTLTVGRRSSGEIVATTSQDIQVELGSVRVARPATPYEPSELSLQVHNDTEFGETLRLLGYSLPIDAPRPGHITFIDLYWLALATPGENWQQRIRLLDGTGTAWAEQLGPLSLPGFDPVQWQAGDLVRGRAHLALSGKMPSGEYRIELTLLDEDGNAVPASEIWRAETTESVVIGPARVDSWAYIESPPPTPYRPDVVFGNAIRLWGYDIQGQARPGAELQITLVWRDEVSVTGDYRVFIHLMDSDHTLLGQADGVPAQWNRPTSTWRQGEYIVDQHLVPISQNAQPGPLYVWMGLYSPDGGRLPLSTSEDSTPDRTLLDILIIEP